MAYPLASKRHVRSPLLCQVLPFGVDRRNQRNLLRPNPAFQLLLTTHRFPNVVKTFLVDETIAMILVRKSFEFPTFVFCYAAVDVIGHSDVQGAGGAADNVNPIFFRVHISRAAVEKEPAPRGASREFLFALPEAQAGMWSFDFVAASRL